MANITISNLSNEKTTPLASDYLILDSDNTYKIRQDNLVKILPNNSRINNIEHFYQTTKPTTRGDGSALVVGDRWWKTDEGTEWFWNGTYWLSSQYFVESLVASVTLSSTNLNVGFNFNSSIGFFNLLGNSNGLTLDFFYEQIIFRCSPTSGTFDASNYWTFTHNLGGVTAAGTTISLITHTLLGTYDGSTNAVFLSYNIIPSNGGTSMRVGHQIAATKIGNPPNVSRLTSSYKVRIIYP